MSSSGRRAASAVGLPVAGTLAVVGLWWWSTALFDIRTFLLPNPPQVAAVFVRLGGYLTRNTWVTLAETAQGFGVATAAGLLMGLLLASSQLVARALYPCLVALQAVPKLALAPLLVVWLGFGQSPKIVMVVLVCLFPIVLSTTTGLTRTPTELTELARSLAASRWQTFVKIRIPYALPQIFTGLKTAMPLAVIGAVVGELFGATAGLGFVIQTAGPDTALVFAALALLAAMSIGLFYLLVAAERLFVPWLTDTTD